MIFYQASWRRDVAVTRHLAGRRQSAFTLLELMVALAILAIALSAVMRAVGAATGNVDELRLRTLAGWVADNRLAEHRALRQWLPVGRKEGRVAQGGVEFRWVEEVQATPNAQFRRLEVSVWTVPETDGSREARVLATLTGFVNSSGGAQ
ncbi:MAG: type II secretion system minor pseudopilin GspI [Azonexus sp.]